MRHDKIILLLLVVAISLAILLATGVGYAVENDYIRDNTLLAPGQTEFKVEFNEETAYTGDGVAILKITGPKTAIINITGLENVGDSVTSIFTIENKSIELYADIYAEVTNTNTEYFKITSTLSESSVKPKLGTTNLEITVELIKLPIKNGIGELTNVSWIGLILACLTLFPHEFLHAICFKGDVDMYIASGGAFVCGTENMSKFRFIFMSMLPNIVFGFIPFIIFLIFPNLTILGTMGFMAIAMGAGDYYNVFNALTQMPRGARCFMEKQNSYWYMPESEQ